MSFEIRESITPGSENAFAMGRRSRGDQLSDLPDVHRTLLNDAVPVTVTLATVGESGRPQLTPIRFSHDGTHLPLNSARGRAKDRNLRERGVASLLVVDPKNPHPWLSIDVDGVADEDDPEPGQLVTRNANDHSAKYLGVRPHPLRDPKGEVRVLYRVRPHRILTFGPVEG